MSYRKDYDDDYFYDDPEEGWEDKTGSPRPKSREYFYGDEIQEDEIERMRRRRQQPESFRRSSNGKKRPASGQGQGEYSRSKGADSRRRDSRQPDPRSRKGRTSSGNRKKKQSKKIFAGIGICLLVIIGVLFIQRWWKTRDGYWNIAVFGVDSRSGSLEKGALSDVELICSINKKTNEISLVSVYRDTYLQIDEKGNFDKINEAYFLGGHEQAVSALERNLDIEIDDYATFNWKAVADAINLLGGIDLEITDKEFAYINSFITETVESTGVGSHHLEHSGMNHLDGVQAVAYSRLRLMDTDFNRTERQRKVIMLALEKAKQADISVLSNIVAGVLPQLSTSIGAEDVMPIAKSISKYEIAQTAGFPFAKTTVRIHKKDCVIPMTLESNVAALHQFLYGEDASYGVSSKVKEISGKISEASGVYEEGKIPGFIYNHPEDKNEGGQTGGNSQGNSQGNSSGSSSKPAVQETPAPTPAPTIEETTVPETSEAESESKTESESAESESETIESNKAPEEPSESTKDSENGPSETTKATEIGPGADLPDPDTSSPGMIHSGSESPENNSPGSDSNQSGPGMPEELPLYAPSYE